MEVKKEETSLALEAAQLSELLVKQTGPRLDAGGATFLPFGLG